MYDAYIPVNTSLRCKKFACLLAFFWSLGVVLGMVLAAGFHSSVLPLMRMVITDQVSIIGLAAVPFLPFVISVVAMRLTMPWIFYIVTVVKGICYGFTAYSLVISYSDSAWLISCLVAFSAHSGQIPLILFWIRYMNDSTKRWKRDAIVCCALFTLIGFVDYFVISPFLSTLMR